MENEFLALINQHQGLIYKVCHLYADSPADVEDLFQEIVSNLWKGYPSFSGRSKVSTWMYRVALNTAISELRRNTRRPPSEPLDLAFSSPLEGPDEQQQQLYQAIKQLNPVERGIISLYLDGYSYREIGDMLGMTDNAIGVRLNRLKIKLREMLLNGSR